MSTNQIKNKNMAYVSIIAIVAIVGMFIMFSGTTKTTTTATTENTETLAGQAIYGEQHSIKTTWFYGHICVDGDVNAKDPYKIKSTTLGPRYIPSHIPPNLEGIIKEDECLNGGILIEWECTDDWPIRQLNGRQVMCDCMDGACL